MTRGSLSVRTSGATLGSPALEIIAGASKGFYLREMQLSLNAATASVYALGRPAAKGVLPTTPVNFLCEESKDASPLQASVALAWTTTAPTAPTAFYKRISQPATIGDLATWYFDKLFVPAGFTIVLWNITVNSVADVNMVIDEVNQ
jgi:hypothetical protein